VARARGVPAAAVARGVPAAAPPLAEAPPLATGGGPLALLLAHRGGVVEGGGVEGGGVESAKHRF
jgi:hypothetical protein